MVINLSKYNWILILILSSSELFPREINLLFLVSILAYYCLIKGGKIPIAIPGSKFYYALLILGLSIGIINVATEQNTSLNLLKHFMYFLLPLFFWQVGYLLSLGRCLSQQRKKNLESIILIASILSLYDLLRTLTNFLSNSQAISNLYGLRTEFGRGSYIPIIAIYLILFYAEEVKIKKRLKDILLVLFITSILIHLSRTHLIILLVLFFFSGLKRNMKYIISSMFLFLVGMGVLYFYFPNLILDFSDKISQSMAEITFAKNSWSYKDIIWNWRGYEMYSALNHFKYSSIMEQMLGGGFGTVLYVGELAYLVSDLPYLLFLHNGYFTTLLVFGLTGVLLFVLWMINIFKDSKFVHHKQDANFIRGLSVVMLLTTYFVNGPLFSVSQATFLLYIGLFSNKLGE